MGKKQIHMFSHLQLKKYKKQKINSRTTLHTHFGLDCQYLKASGEGKSLVNFQFVFCNKSTRPSE